MKKILITLIIPIFGISQENMEFNLLSPNQVFYEQVGPYCDTNKCGRWLTYYPNGEVGMVETFDENGKLKGERVTFRTDSSIKHYTEWKDGIKVGKEIFFNEQGEPKKIIYNNKK